MEKPQAVIAIDVPLREKQTSYPEPFASMVTGREKRQLGDVFGLMNFGVNLTRLLPGGRSALRHKHTVQDEFIYILEGTPTLITEQGEKLLQPGMCAGFKADEGDGHHLINNTDKDVVLLEVGDRLAGDSVNYPDDDIQAVRKENRWVFAHKDGIPY
ncbi:MAG: cupin domain-containing protein [Pseudomonadota bacterium]